MVLEEVEDFVLGSSGDEFFGRRCVNCGEIVDPVIAAHRRLTSQPATSHSALTSCKDASSMHTYLSRIGGAATLNGVSR